MPTNKEIAGWLREEKDMYVRLSEITEGAIKDLLLAKVQLIEDRATQVEQSSAGRCESCRRYLPVTDKCYPAVGFGKRAVTGQGPQFGCIHWEQKTMNLCASCGKEIAEGASLCPECEEKIIKKEVGT